MSRCGARLFTRERCEHLYGGLCLSGTAMRRAENEAGVGMPRGGFENLVRLLYSESGVPLQESCSMTKCYVERSNGFRNAVQRYIQSHPLCYQLIRISCACFVKSATP